ncbi:MAG: hypothetical protein DRP86_04380 [Candidatus Neomarinimicrobiota bacterium]|nr:MAG: hypothetical protein DRP86_04380 [Candidatus Neomarinimicrobiota bacterium]
MKLNILNLFLAILALNGFLYAGEDETRITHFGFIRFAFVSEPVLESQYFSVFQARWGMKGKASDRLGYKLYAEFSSLGSLDIQRDSTGYLTHVSVDFPAGLLDAYIDMFVTDQLRFQFGQMKVPFSDSNLKSPASMPFVYRPLTRQIAPPIRDIGVLAEWTPGDRGFKFSAGLFNGEGANAVNADEYLSGGLRGEVPIFDNHRISVSLFTDKSKSRIKRGQYINGAYLWSGKRFESGSEIVIQNRNEKSSNAFYVFMKTSIETNKPWLMSFDPAFRFEHLYEAGFGKTTQMTTGCTFHLDKSALNIFRVEYIHPLDDNGAKALTALLQITW